MIDTLMRHAGPFALLLVNFILWTATLSVAQNVVVNADFSEGETGWTVYQMQPLGSPVGEVMFDDTDDCPTDGSPGGCAFMFGTGDEQPEVLLWQEITLIAGTPYIVDAQFRYLADDAFQNWSELYLGDEAPVEFANWLGFSHWSFNWWEGCSGLGVDGWFSEHACAGRQTREFIPAGEPGTEVTYYVGIKSGMWQGGHFALAIDDVTVEKAGDTFAVAQFTTEPSGRVVLGNPIAFDASSSTASGSITSYEWDLGDGTAASGATVEHTYDAYGRYDVQLTVTSDDGATSTASQRIQVWDGIGLEETPLEIPMAPAAPEIDGAMDAAYNAAQMVVLGNVANGTAPADEDDLHAVAYVMWDAERLYVFFDVTDDVIVTDHADIWQNDTPEFYIDGDNSKNERGSEEHSYDENDTQVEMVFGRTTVTGRGSNEGVEVAGAEKADGTGYFVEASYPWASIDVEAVAGLEIGFELMVNDNDEGASGGRKTKLSWFSPDGVDEAFRDPSAWGTAVLVLELSTSTEDPSELPGTFAIESIYPNPFNPSATAVLAIPATGDYTVRLFDVLGQQIEEKQLNAQSPGRIQIPFDLAGQASGIYLVWVQQRTTGRVVMAKAMFVK